MPYKDPEVRKAYDRKRHLIANMTPEQVEQKRARGRKVPAGHRLRGVSKLVDQGGELLKEWQKTERRPDDPPAVPVDPGPSFFEKKRSSMLDRQGEALIQWRSFEQEKVQQWNDMLAACEEVVKKYEGLSRGLPMAGTVHPQLANVFAVGDPHLGMLAWSRETGMSFDSKIASDDLKRAFDMLVARCPQAALGVLAEVGDLAHAEDDKQETFGAGHKLDVDTRAGKLTELIFSTIVYLIDLMLTKHEKVVVIAARGNHDPYKAIYLAIFLRAFYRNEPRVEILDNNDPYIYYSFGKNLWGVHHGDGAKAEQLPGIMAEWQDGVPWGQHVHRMWFTGHYHSEKSRDFPGCFWEQFRTLAPNDFWAHHKGYRGAKSVDCLTFDFEHGFQTRQQVNLRQVRSQ